MNSIKTFFLMMLLASLAACGGAGSGTTAAPAEVNTTTTPVVVTPPAVVSNSNTPTIPINNNVDNTSNTTELTNSSNTGNTNAPTHNVSNTGNSNELTNSSNTGNTSAPTNNSGNTDDNNTTVTLPTNEPVFVTDTGQQRSFPLLWLPDGSRLLGANRDNVFKVWEGRYDILRQALSGHTDWVQAIAVTADSRLLASGGQDASLRFWGNTDGKIGAFGFVQTETSGIRALSFSPTGTFLAVAGSNGSLQLWDYSRRQLQTNWQAHQGIAYSVAYSPDGLLLASGGADGKIQLWDALSGEKHGELGSHHGVVYQLLFSADGKQLISAGGDGRILSWDITEKRLVGEIGQHDAAIYALALAADGVTLAAGDVGGSVGIWRIAATKNNSSAKPLAGVSKQMAVAGSGAIHALAFDPLGTQLAVSSDDAMIRIWDAVSGQLQRTMTTAGAEGPPEPEPEPEPVDYSSVISISLAELAFSSMKQVLATDELLVQPSRFTNAFLLDINQPPPLPCGSNNGTYAYHFTDYAPVNKRYADAGDDFAVTISNCRATGGSITLSGAYGLQLTANNTPNQTETDLRLENFLVNDGIRPVTLQGNLHLSTNSSTNGISPSTTTISSNQLALQLHGWGNYAFNSLDANLATNPVSDDQQITYNAALILSSSSNILISNGHYTITTLLPFEMTSFDNYPKTGKLQIQSLASGQSVIITVLDNQRVKIETDRDGNTVIDSVQEVPWSTLSSRFRGN